jgi:hypothetical protein
LNRNHGRVNGKTCIGQVAEVAQAQCLQVAKMARDEQLS